MKQRFSLNPKDINQPIQLLGASLIGAVFLVGEFLFASTMSQSQIMAWVFAAAAVLIFPAILYFIFILQTKYRIELQGDYFFNEAMKRTYKEESNKAEKFKFGDK